MRRAAAVLVLVALGIAPGCSRRGLGQDEARLSGSGNVEASSPNRAWHEVTGGTTLHRGERVRVRSGTARLQLSDDRSLELRGGSTLELDRVPRLLAGDALATSPGTPLHVSVAGTDARVANGAARLQRGLAVVIAAYQGEVQLDSAGRTLRVPALRQAVVTAAGLIPDRPAPLAYDALDAWDRRFLGDAIDLGAELVARSRGFTAQLSRGEGRTAGFYRQLVPALEREPDFTQKMVDESHSPGELLVGAAISTEGKRGRFAERWSQVFQFRDDGAAWGLVALDQQVNRSPLLTGVDAAIGRARTPFDVAAPAPAPAAPAPPAPQPEPAPAGSTPRAGQPAKPPASGGPTASTPSSNPTLPKPTPGSPITQPVQPGLLDNTLSGLLDAVGGLLGPKR
jgi:hypothetical protein